MPTQPQLCAVDVGGDRPRQRGLDEGEGPHFDQLICTHCTRETSAIYRSSGGSRLEIAGYTPRASSLSGDPLLRTFGLVKPLLSYELPGDATDSDRQTRTADTAPRRLLHRVMPDGRLVIGQVCYRARDATGHAAGSYMAHFLIRDASPAWHPCNSLQLWEAPWFVDEELSLSELPHAIPLRAPAGGACDAAGFAVGDQLFEEFLRRPAISHLRHFVPDLWIGLNPLERQEWFGRLLEQFLDAVAAGERLVMIARPEFAALLFSGIFRILPQHGFSHRLEFSTYETELRDMPYSLAATTTLTAGGHDDLVRRLQELGIRFADTARPVSDPHPRVGRAYAREALLPFRPWADARSDASAMAVLDEHLARFSDKGGDGPRTLECLSLMYPIARRFCDPDRTDTNAEAAELSTAAGTTFTRIFPESSPDESVIERLLIMIRTAMEAQFLGHTPEEQLEWISRSSPERIYVVLEQMALLPPPQRGFWNLLGSLNVRELIRQLHNLLKSPTFPLHVAIEAAFADRIDARPNPVLRTRTVRRLLFSKIVRSGDPSGVVKRLLDASAHGEPEALRAINWLIEERELDDELLCRLIVLHKQQLLSFVSNKQLLTERMERILGRLGRIVDGEPESARKQFLLRTEALGVAHGELVAVPVKSLAQAWSNAAARLSALKRTRRPHTWKLIESIAEPIRQANGTLDGHQKQAGSRPGQHELIRAAVLFRDDKILEDRINAYFIKRKGHPQSFKTWFWYKRCLDDFVDLRYKHLMKREFLANHDWARFVVGLGRYALPRLAAAGAMLLACALLLWLIRTVLTSTAMLQQSFSQ